MNAKDEENQLIFDSEFEYEETTDQLKAIREKMDDLAKNASDEELKKLSKERDNAMKKLGIKTIPSMNGDKSMEKTLYVPTHYQLIF